MDTVETNKRKLRHGMERRTSALLTLATCEAGSQVSSVLEDEFDTPWKKR
jgi:hypothetical protein